MGLFSSVELQISVHRVLLGGGILFAGRGVDEGEPHEFHVSSPCRHRSLILTNSNWPFSG